MCEKCDEMKEFMDSIEDVAITLPLQHFFGFMSLIKASIEHEDYETTLFVADKILSKIKSDAEEMKTNNFSSNLGAWE